VQPSREPPPRILPIVYFALGHVSLVLALLVPALEPASIDSYFFQPRMFFVVHLLTLGWITHSIVGATYLAAPMALRMTLRAGKLDGVVCAAIAIGASGVIAHFWLDEYSGVAWSGLILLLAFGAMAVRVWIALFHAKSPAAVRVAFGCAYLNLLLTALLGTLLAINKITPFLPGNHIQDVYAHAHLGLIGWALLAFVAVGSRMLPMFLPARPPSGKKLWVPVALLQGGVFGFVAAWAYAPAMARWAALALAAGIAAFLLQVIGMLRNRLPAPPKMPRPDPGMIVARQALVYLLASTGLGLYLVFAERFSLGGVMVYGTFALLGFFGQIILGIEMRLLPMFAWLQAWTASGHQELPPSPHVMPLRSAQFAAMALWTTGVPILAYGLATTEHRVVSTGAWIVLIGSLAALAGTAKVLAYVRR
jgi:hypothetical protein